MAVNLYYRIDAKNPPKPTSNVVLGVPLSMLQIDANWKSVSDNLDSNDEILKEHGELIDTKAPINNPKFTGYVQFPTTDLEYPNTLPEGSVYFDTNKQMLMVKNNGKWSSMSTGDSLDFYLPLKGGTLSGNLTGTNGEFFGFLSCFNPTADPTDENTKTEKVATTNWVDTTITKVLYDKLGIKPDDGSSDPSNPPDNSMTIVKGDMILKDGVVVAQQLYGDIDCGELTIDDL